MKNLSKNLNHTNKIIPMTVINTIKSNNSDIKYIVMNEGTELFLNILFKKGYTLVVDYIRFDNKIDKKNNKPSMRVKKTVSSLEKLGIRTTTKAGVKYYRFKLSCLEVESIDISKQETVSFGAYSNGLGAVYMGMIEAGLQVDQRYSFEIDKFAKQTLAYNYDIKIQHNDIFDADAKALPQVEIIGAGFPCTDFSISGKQLGFKAKRGTIIFKLGDTFLELIKLRKAPKIIFLENVVNLSSHNKSEGIFKSKFCEKDFDGEIGHTLMTIENEVFEPLLEFYDIVWWLDNTLNYKNIPHNRPRWYCIMTLKTSKFSFDLEKLKNKRVPLTTTFNDFLDNEEDVETASYYTKNRFIPQTYKNGGVLNQVGVVENITFGQSRRVLSPNGAASCLTCGDSSKYLINGRLRTPSINERMKLQYIPKWFKFDPKTSRTQRIKQLGNTMSINLVQSIFEVLFDKTTFKTNLPTIENNPSNQTKYDPTQKEVA